MTSQTNKFTFMVLQYKSIVPKSQQYGITAWNVGDGDSRIRFYFNKNDWPLLFDDSYSRKAIYYAFLKALMN